MEQWDEDYFNMELQAYITSADELEGSIGLLGGDRSAFKAQRA
jgi:ethanolamine utilization microcompartment shell protein EutL